MVVVSLMVFFCLLRFKVSMNCCFYVGMVILWMVWNLLISIWLLVWIMWMVGRFCMVECCKVIRLLMCLFRLVIIVLRLVSFCMWFGLFLILLCRFLVCLCSLVRWILLVVMWMLRRWCFLCMVLNILLSEVLCCVMFCWVVCILLIRCLICLWVVLKCVMKFVEWMWKWLISGLIRGRWEWLLDKGLMFREWVLVIIWVSFLFVLFRLLLCIWFSRLLV